MSRKKSLKEKFWDNVDKSNDCWLWTGCVNNGGYGALNLNGNFTMAHRFSWEYHNNKKIPEKHDVMHICDTPNCVNPKHLKIGTRLDNMQDAKMKMRVGFGEKNGMAKLKESQVIKIRELHKKKKHSIKELALLYNISHHHIYQIVTNVKWCYLNE